MNKQLIRDLAITGGIYDCITDPYDKLKNGDPYSSVMIDLERFVELIIQECAEVINKDIMYQVEQGVMSNVFGLNQARELIKHHFGIEE